LRATAVESAFTPSIMDHGRSSGQLVAATGGGGRPLPAFREAAHDRALGFSARRRGASGAEGRGGERWVLGNALGKAGGGGSRAGGNSWLAVDLAARAQRRLTPPPQRQRQRRYGGREWRLVVTAVLPATPTHLRPAAGSFKQRWPLRSAITTGNGGCLATATPMAMGTGVCLYWILALVN
jgi:hypothetical protein